MRIRYDATRNCRNNAGRFSPSKDFMMLFRSLLFATVATLFTGGVAAPVMAAAPERLQRVLDAGELRVCVWPAYYGISYRNPKTG
jgi:ABC-type amino acid transport substrate-binding protein